MFLLTSLVASVLIVLLVLLALHLSERVFEEPEFLDRRDREGGA